MSRGRNRTSRRWRKRRRGEEEKGGGGEGEEEERENTYVLERLHLAQNARHLRVVLALQLVEHRIAILAPAVRRRGPEPAAGPAAPADAVRAAAAVARVSVSVAVAVAVRRGARRRGAPRLRGVARVALEQGAARVALVQRRGAESGDGQLIIALLPSSPGSFRCSAALSELRAAWERTAPSLEAGRQAEYERRGVRFRALSYLCAMVASSPLQLSPLRGEPVQDMP